MRQTFRTMNSVKRILVGVCLFISTGQIVAQQLIHFPIDIRVADRSLRYATAGGLNMPQYSTADFNADGIDDLYVFDKAGNVHLTFLGKSDSTGYSYEWAPAFRLQFPLAIEWILLRDFDQDGAVDIFTYSDVPGIAGIQVHKGFFETDTLRFARLPFPGNPYNLLPTLSNAGAPIFAAPTDLPVIDDIDGDGDLDILAFGAAGGYVEYFKNASVEMGYGKDSLLFEKADACWGKFYEKGGSTQWVVLSDNPEDCGYGRIQDPVKERFLHGATSLLTFDRDGDGDKELLLGDLVFTDMLLLTNGGSANQAFMTGLEPSFPIESRPVDLPYMPAAFYADVNGDGHRDMLCAPFADQSENSRVTWLYENTGRDDSPRFQFRQEDFLVGEMLDLGSGTHPALADVDGDGLIDLVIGNFGQLKPDYSKDARLYLYKNRGTRQYPVFELTDSNWLNFRQFNPSSWNFKPVFADLDSDGDFDLLVGESGGKIYFAENLGGAGMPMHFPAISSAWMGFNVQFLLGFDTAPTVADLNRDGLPDLILGERNGNLNYFQNIGSKEEPLFDPNPNAAVNNSRWGGINLQELGETKGYTQPLLLDHGDDFTLLLGTETLGILRFEDIQGNLQGKFTRVSSPFETMANDGHLISPAIADLNDDGYFELVAGNWRGGLSAYQTSMPVDQSVPVRQPDIESRRVSLRPNPASDLLHVQWQTIDNQVQTTVQIFHGSGTLAIVHSTRDNQLVMPIHHLPPGIYYCRIKNAGASFVLKFIKS